MRKIKRNAAQCRLCGDIIESRSTHDFVMCKCKSCFVDGGHEYLRRGFAHSPDDMIELSEYYEDEKEKPEK